MKKKLTNTKRQDNAFFRKRNNKQHTEHLENDSQLSAILNSSKYDDKDNEDM